MNMTGLSVWVSSPYQQDALFDLGSELNRDNCLMPFVLLKKCIEKHGYLCHTNDYFIHENESSSDILFLNIPKNIKKLSVKYSSCRFHLLIQECEVVMPRNWRSELHQYFETIFTWDPRLYLLGGKYRRSFFSQIIRFNPGSIPFNDKNLCTLICANKASSHPFELYSHRRELIQWFESNNQDLFDLFGIGWDRLYTSNFYVNKLLQLSGVNRFLSPNLSTYRGMVEQKNITLHNYRFGFCYENAHSIAGYVTEKIFDVMMAGAVPVYLGAPDIIDYVPGDCFIDAGRFSNHQQLVDYMLNISADEHAAIVDRIEKYLDSDQAKLFSAGHFSQSICHRICECA